MTFRRIKRNAKLAAGVAAWLITIQSDAGLTIVPIFDSTVTGAANSADYIAGFNFAAGQFS